MMKHRTIENIFEHNVRCCFSFSRTFFFLVFHSATSNNRTVPSNSSSQQQRQNGDKDKKSVKDVTIHCIDFIR